jgi:CRISPR-associated protein Cas1
MELHLQTFGSKLRVKDGIFKITKPDLSGAGLHEEEEHAAHQVKTLLLQSGTSVSVDALILALQQDTDLLVLDHFGNPLGRLLSNRPTSTLTIWKNQLDVSLTTEALRIAKGWIESKIRGRIQYLRGLKNHRSASKQRRIEQAEADMSDMLARLHRLPLRDVEKTADSIRGLEGTAGRHYLSVLNDLLPEEYRFDGRSTQPAEDMFNAFLNYGYGILYRKVERALVLAGVHPYIGFMHRDGYQRTSMVYDFIEPFRVWMEKTVLKLFFSKLPNRQHLQPHGDNGVWLNTLGTRLLNSAFNKFIQEETQELEGRWFALEHYLTESARRFAALLLGWNRLAVAVA